MIVVSKLVADTDGFIKVRTDGTVWTCRIRGGNQRKKCKKWRRLNPSSDKNGYQIITLYINGKRKDVKVHTLVLTAFRGPKPKGKEGRHYPDRNPANENPI